MKNIVIFASGTGTNAKNILSYFAKNDKNVVVNALFTNNRKAKVLEVANLHSVPAFYFNSPAFYNSTHVSALLKSIDPHLIVLAGFLWKIPEYIINTFPGKIINIHPALLPRYGGKGMYGMHVHNAVVKNREKETGITIHYVNENYDEGAVIFQEKTPVSATDTPEEVAGKVHRLEHEHFPKIIEKILYGEV